MVRFCSLFDAKERTVTFLNGQKYPLASLRALGMGSLLDAMFEFSEKLGSMGLEPDEMALFMAVVLVSAGVCAGTLLVRDLSDLHILGRTVNPRNSCSKSTNCKKQFVM